MKHLYFQNQSAVLIRREDNLFLYEAVFKSQLVDLIINENPLEGYSNQLKEFDNYIELKLTGDECFIQYYDVSS